MFYLTFLVCLFYLFRSFLRVFSAPFSSSSFGAPLTSPPLHTIHYTLWNSVHIECMLPINCSNRRMFRCSDVVNTVSTYNTLEEQQGRRHYSTRCSLTIPSFQNTEGTRPAWASKCDDRTVIGVPYAGSSPSGVGGLPLRREMTCILLI